MRSVFLCIFLFSMILVNGQSSVKGTVYRADNKQVVSNAVVLLFNEANNDIIEHQYSKTDGNFQLNKTISQGVYRLEISKLGFEKNSHKIYIDVDSNKEIQIDSYLQEKSYVIDEIQINIASPIVVKKDTIIYDVTQYAKVHDESLEDVLAKMEGVKIQGDGSIEVQGKAVHKVLIDGKEVSDLGAGILTKSIGAEKVASVEVRFDEKNEKIKNSLLDEQKFVVLDIKLKPDVQKSFFGKQSLTLGYQDKVKVGGLSNFFSLNKKANFQVFLENNNFDTNIIELSHIRNIGEEAMISILSVPVNYDEIKSKSSFQDEIYGFKNFISNDKTLLGFSLNLPLSEKQICTSEVLTIIIL